MNGPADPRLILREDELDAGLEVLLLAEASIWAAVDQGWRPRAWVWAAPTGARPSF